MARSPTAAPNFRLADNTDNVLPFLELERQGPYQVKIPFPRSRVRALVLGHQGIESHAPGTMLKIAL